jgi:hypothetical protein
VVERGVWQRPVAECGRLGRGAGFISPLGLLGLLMELTLVVYHHPCRPESEGSWVKTPDRRVGVLWLVQRVMMRLVALLPPLPLPKPLLLNSVRHMRPMRSIVLSGTELLLRSVGYVCLMPPWVVEVAVGIGGGGLVAFWCRLRLVLVVYMLPFGCGCEGCG